MRFGSSGETFSLSSEARTPERVSESGLLHQYLSEISE
jgi:hypothetical protein